MNLLLRLPQALRFQSQAGKLEARETGSGKTKLGPVHDVRYKNSLILPTYRHIWKEVEFEET